MPGLEGTTLGRYRLQRRLGRGGMSTVYLAQDDHMGREVAVKVVSNHDADYIERFRREAGAIGKLNHDHILPAYDFGEHYPWLYLVMPHIAYGTLRERMARGRLTLEEAGEMLEQIASALQFAHDRGIIHRDIKPSNILLRDDHYAYLADFGLAKALEGASNVTQTGTLLGTPEYMAPELAQGTASISSDVYALGVLLYQMVTGRVPFTGDTPISIFWKQMREQPVPPSQYNPAISRSVEQVILRALEKDPAHRYQSAQALSQAYKQALKAPTKHETVEMPPLSEVKTLSSSATLNQPAQVPQGKLVLPGSSPADLPAHLTHPLPPSGSRAQLPLQSLGQGRELARGTMYPVNSPVPPVPARKRFISPVLIAFIIGLGLLLILSSLIGLLFFNNPSKGAITTPDTHATASVLAANATATQQNQVHPTPGTTATATSTVSASPTSVPRLEDNLSANTNGRWLENSACFFNSGAYHIKVTVANFLQFCQSPVLTFDNAGLQVDVTLLSGNSAGFIFRATENTYYDFEISNQGEYFFRRHDAGSGLNTYTYLVQKTKSSAINPGDQKNTMLVIANSANFRLVINGIQVTEIVDNKYPNGQFGFVAGTNELNSGEAIFTNFKVFNV